MLTIWVSYAIISVLKDLVGEVGELCCRLHGRIDRTPTRYTWNTRIVDMSLLSSTDLNYWPLSFRLDASFQHRIRHSIRSQDPHNLPVAAISNYLWDMEDHCIGLLLMWDLH